MILDVATLTLAGGLVTCASSLFLLAFWWQDRAAWGGFWWAIANGAMGLGIVLLAARDILPVVVSKIVVPVILNNSAALAWAAAGIFNRGNVRPAPAVCIAACMSATILVGASVDERLAATFGAATAAALYGAASVEFWLGRAEPLRGRWPMICLLGLEAISVALVATSFATSDASLAAPPIGWFGIIHFVGIAYGVGSAISIVTMLKERTEARHKAAALVDPLTGLANRRAFLERAEVLLAQSAREHTPVSLLAFDLDHFKKVNDTFGHPIGDQVLRVFSDVLFRVLRPSDVAGRLGGEEFVALLPGCGAQAAIVIAGRIRAAFQEDARFVAGQAVGATVSIGVTTSDEPDATMEALISGADRALYRAKDLGRNRVMLSGIDGVAPKAGKLTKVA